MEKSKPHHSLKEVQELIRAGFVRLTKVARQDAVRMGMFEADVFDVACSLTGQDFL